MHTADHSKNYPARDVTSGKDEKPCPSFLENTRINECTMYFQEQEGNESILIQSVITQESAHCPILCNKNMDQLVLLRGCVTLSFILTLQRGLHKKLLDGVC